MNKKFNKLLLVLLLIVMIPFVSTAVSCKKKVSSITLISSQTTYNIGDELNLNDFSILITYEDNKTETVAVTGDMLKEALPLLENEGSYTITVNYDKEAYIVTINVVNPKKIENITASDYRTDYFVDEVFTATGKLNVTYQNKEIAKDVYNITNAMIVEMPDMSTAGEKTITINYNGFTCTYIITVTESVISGVHFENIPEFYNTTKSDEIDLNGNRLVVEYSDGRVEYVAITNEMITFVPDFNDGSENYSINIDYMGHTYGLPVNVTTHPRYAEYQKIVEALEDMLENAMFDTTSIDASILVNLSSRMMGQTETINEQYGITMSVEEISDMYLRALAKDIVKTAIELSNYDTYEDFLNDMDLTDINSNIDIIEFAMNFMNKFMVTTMNLDMYEYINSYPELAEYKDMITEALTDVINGLTFDVKTYNEDAKIVEEDGTGNIISVSYAYSDNYQALYDIVEETIIKEIILRTFDGQKFLTEFKAYANTFRNDYPELTEATIKVVNDLVNYDPAHILSTFIKNELNAIRKLRASREDYYYKDLEVSEMVADIIRYVENYMAQDEEVTLEETLKAISDRIDVFKAYCDEENLPIPEIIIVLDYSVKIAIRPETTVTLVYDLAYTRIENKLFKLLDKLDGRLYNIDIEYNPEEESYSELLERVSTLKLDCETRLEQLDYEENYREYTDTLTELERLTLCEEVLIDVVYNDNLLYTLDELYPIVFNYVQNVINGEDVDNIQFTVDLLKTLQLKDYQEFYDENGYITLVEDFTMICQFAFMDQLNDFANVIHPDNMTILMGYINTVAHRIDMIPVTETDLGEDIQTITAVYAYGFIMSEQSIFVNMMQGELADLLEISVDNEEYYTLLNKVVTDIKRIMFLGNGEDDFFLKNLSENMYNLSVEAMNYKAVEHVDELFLEDVYQAIIDSYDEETKTISEEDMKTIIRLFVANYGLTEKNPYYTAFEMILNNDGTMTSDELIAELEYATIIANKEIIINIFFEMLDESGIEIDEETTDLEALYNLVDKFITDVANYEYRDGEEVDVIAFMYDFTEQLKDSDTTMAFYNYLIGKYIDNEFMIALMDKLVDGLYANEPEENMTQTDKDLIASIKNIGEIVDQYFMPYSVAEDTEVNAEELLNTAIETTMTLFKAVAVERDNLPAYIIAELYFNFANQELTEDELVNKITKFVYTMQIVNMIETDSIEIYNDVYEIVSVLYDYSIGQETDEDVVIGTLLNNATFVEFAKEMITDMLGIYNNENAMNDLDVLVDDLIKAYNGEEYVVQELAQEYFDFATNYGGENAIAMYGLGVITLVLNDQNDYVDYNELFKNVKLPESMENIDVDYNNIIKLLITKETILNAVSYEGIKTVTNLNEEGEIESQTMTITLTVDFDITFIVLGGSIDFVLSINY